MEALLSLSLSRLALMCCALYPSVNRRDDDSSDSSDSDEEERRKKKKKKDKKKDKKKKEKKDKKKKKKHKKEASEDGPTRYSEMGFGAGGSSCSEDEDGSKVKYSTISGKKIKMSTKRNKKDKERAINRTSLLHFLNAQYDM